MDWNNQEFIDAYCVSPENFIVRAFLGVHKTVQDAKVLVLGYQSHGIAQILADQGCLVTAVDDRAPYRHGIKSTEFQALLKKPESFPVPSQGDLYDVIVCLDTLSAVRNQKDFAARMRKSLNPNGLLYISYLIGSAHETYGGQIKTFSEESIAALGFGKMKELLRKAMYSQYFLTGGQNEALITEDTVKAFKSEDVPYQLFSVLKKI